MRSVARPAVQLSKEQERLLSAVNKAIDHAAEVAKREDEKVWEKARIARAAGIPDTTICRRTGLNRSTLQTRLGPRPESAIEDASSNPPND